MIGVAGIGWWMDGSWGRLLSDEEGSGEGQQMFSRQFKNFGRLTADSRAAAYAVALALQDAGMDYPVAPGAVAGIAGGSALGCLGSDMLYFQDYVECGRTLGRGNYFIYTLPTSPLAECAIHFGLQGPMLYVGGEYALARAVEVASDAMGDAQATMMLAGGSTASGSTAGEALFAALCPIGGGGGAGEPAGSSLSAEAMDNTVDAAGGVSLDDLLRVLNSATEVGGAVDMLKNLKKTARG